MFGEQRRAKGRRIDWQYTSLFLIMIWSISAIDGSWTIAIGWTVFLICFDLLLMILNKMRIK